MSRREIGVLVLLCIVIIAGIGGIGSLLRESTELDVPDMVAAGSVPRVTPVDEVLAPASLADPIFLYAVLDHDSLRRIELDGDASLGPQEAARKIGKALKGHFGLSLRVASRTEGGTNVIEVDLKGGADIQDSGWYQMFQGSSGGASSKKTIVWTALQPHLNDPIFDEVRILFNGKPIEIMDHADLSDTPFEDSQESYQEAIAEPGFHWAKD